MPPNGAPLGVEILGVAPSDEAQFANLLATVVFCVINSGLRCEPGALFPDVVSRYSISETLDHLMLVPPFLWDGELETMRLQSKTVAWLLAVPISDSEYSLASTNGSAALEDVLARESIDIFNLHRASTV